MTIVPITAVNVVLTDVVNDVLTMTIVPITAVNAVLTDVVNYKL
jgi:hypothetical protein